MLPVFCEARDSKGAVLLAQHVSAMDTQGAHGLSAKLRSGVVAVHGVEEVGSLRGVIHATATSEVEAVPMAVMNRTCCLEWPNGGFRDSALHG